MRHSHGLSGRSHCDINVIPRQQHETFIDDQQLGLVGKPSMIRDSIPIESHRKGKPDTTDSALKQQL